MLIETNNLITAAELAKLKNVTRKTVYKWLTDGNAPPHVMLWGLHLFVREAAEQFKPPTRGRKPRDRQGKD